MVKLKINWLFITILDSICFSLVLAYLYSSLWGEIKQGRLVDNNGWIVTVFCIFIPLFFHFCVYPFWWFFVDESGIGAYGNLGFWKWKIFKGLTNYKYWSEIRCVDFVDSPIWNALMIDADKKLGIYLDFRFFTNKRKAIKLLLQHLPRDKASENAEKYFYQKWEKKLAKDEDLLL